MTKYRFYAEMSEARKSKSASRKFPHSPWTRAALEKRAASEGFVDVIAVRLDDATGRPIYNNNNTMDCISVAIEGNHYSYSNNSVAPDYLRKRAVSISKQLAFKLSPRIVEYL